MPITHQFFRNRMECGTKGRRRSGEQHSYSYFNNRCHKSHLLSLLQSIFSRFRGNPIAGPPDFGSGYIPVFQEIFSIPLAYS